MKKYLSLLGLDFDPFEPGARSRDFFFTQSSKQLLEEVFELSLYSDSIISITGPLGCGKSTLIDALADSYGDEALCIEIKATLFMNQAQFLDALMEQLAMKPNSPDDIEQCLDQLQGYAEQLDLDARSLILILDDAHELSAEVHQVLREILDRCSSIHGILLGESQLENMLRSTLEDSAFDKLARFEVREFGGEEVNEYIRFKLETAGYDKGLPLSGSVVGELINGSNGIPGAINALVSDALENSREEQGEASDKEPQNILKAITPLHWGTAGTLAALLLVTLVFWDSGPQPDSSSGIASNSAAGSGTTTVQIPVNIGGNDRPEELAQSADVVTEPGAENNVEPIIADSEPAEVLVGVAGAIDETIDTASNRTAEEAIQALAQTIPQASPEIIETVAEVEEAQPEPEDEWPLSTFESELMSQVAQNYTIQLLGSRSEENVKNFISSNERQGMGYFETLYQQQPWFVAILGSSGNRASATETINSLPQSLSSLEPWVRPVSDIQSEIRLLHDR